MSKPLRLYFSMPKGQFRDSFYKSLYPVLKDSDPIDIDGVIRVFEEQSPMTLVSKNSEALTFKFDDIGAKKKLIPFIISVMALIYIICSLIVYATLGELSVTQIAFYGFAYFFFVTFYILMFISPVWNNYTIKVDLKSRRLLYTEDSK